MVKVVPTPSLLAVSIRPRRASTFCFTTSIPTPSPEIPVTRSAVVCFSSRAWARNAPATSVAYFSIALLPQRVVSDTSRPRPPGESFGSQAASAFSVSAPRVGDFPAGQPRARPFSTGPATGSRAPARASSSDPTESTGPPRA